MIIQLKGKVTYPITLDASVWIFDDRKIILEEAFTEKEVVQEEDPLKKADEMFNQEIYFQTKIKPPVNKSINRYEKEKILENSFVMPLEDFINNAEVKPEAKRALLKTDGDDIVITVEQLTDAYLLFAVDGKPLKEEGPVHLYFRDGSNKEAPIKNIKQIIIK
ncbi:hypothetical protein ACFSKI_17455 [Pseudogracilibacillus auburnensis]|uniref:Peptidyl-prolyl cis-trans isomerase n=1 Tax=Pseudogracilibacillus auburnensis TaxID=1494959 RepID=A0A2V3W8D6_9BACI|nr:hypothetical protein [Pseudogracilibacillus auburnensis]MBO1003552.1 hypothetical protein [Pseudogracilibacillus auburnensis]PXW89241.1 hypothetical protein DFR56_10217 [Pseudogracilibacillus auburnensis]